MSAEEYMRSPEPEAYMHVKSMRIEEMREGPRMWREVLPRSRSQVPGPRLFRMDDDATQRDALVEFTWKIRVAAFVF